MQEGLTKAQLSALRKASEHWFTYVTQMTTRTYWDGLGWQNEVMIFGQPTFAAIVETVVGNEPPPRSSTYKIETISHRVAGELQNKGLVTCRIVTSYNCLSLDVTELGRLLLAKVDSQLNTG